MPPSKVIGGGYKIHPETARKSGRYGAQYAAHREGMCGTGAVFFGNNLPISVSQSKVKDNSVHAVSPKVNDSYLARIAKGQTDLSRSGMN